MNTLKRRLSDHRFHLNMVSTFRQRVLDALVDPKPSQRQVEADRELIAQHEHEAVEAYRDAIRLAEERNRCRDLAGGVVL